MAMDELHGRSGLAVGDEGREAELCTVPAARALIVLVDASGDGQRSQRSTALAGRFQREGMSTLSLELTTRGSGDDPPAAGDVERMARRVLQAIDALPPTLHDLPLGVFASGVAAAAALLAATRRPQRVAALVLRSGRPDLAGEALGDVRAPTLLIVGAADAEVRRLNRQALEWLRCEKRFDVVPRATRLFMEAGAVEILAHAAADWFGTHLGSRVPP